MFSTSLCVDVDKLISHLSKMSSECQVTHVLKNWILDADLYIIKWCALKYDMFQE